MIDIYVQRYGGDRPGRDIVDELIGSLPVALARGRNELDEHAQYTQVVSLEAVYRDGLRLGQLVYCNDVVRGFWAGKIVGISHSWSDGVLLTRLQVKRPMK